METAGMNGGNKAQNCETWTEQRNCGHETAAGREPEIEQSSGTLETSKAWCKTARRSQTRAVGETETRSGRVRRPTGNGGGTWRWRSEAKWGDLRVERTTQKRRVRARREVLSEWA
ncbi:hypothetical protein PIB30_104309, partial [Stylosanthes scabra]|nr:hypothetical protein [Stylosanthes scabra]